MRILIFSYEYPPLGGGGGVVVAALAEAWVAAGHAVTVVTTSATPSTELTTAGGLRVFRAAVPLRTRRATASLVSLLAYPAAALAVVLRELKQTEFDVIVSGFAVPSGIVGGLISRLWRLPHLVIVMGGDIYDPSKRLSPHRTPGLRQAVALVLRTADWVVAGSHDVAQRARSIYGLDRPALVLPFTMPLQPSAQPRQPSNQLRLVTIARLVRRKRVASLIEAMAALPAGTVHLTVLGDGPERVALEHYALELGVHDLEFRGYVSEQEKLAVLRDSDAFALVSEHEGFGLVYLEAASQGLPIVAGTVGGQTDFLEHGRTGWLVEPGNVQQLSNALAVLATQPLLRQSMSRAVRSVAERFDITAVAQAYLDLFAAQVATSPATSRPTRPLTFAKPDA